MDVEDNRKGLKASVKCYSTTVQRNYLLSYWASKTILSCWHMPHSYGIYMYEQVWTGNWLTSITLRNAHFHIPTSKIWFKGDKRLSLWFCHSACHRAMTIPWLWPTSKDNDDFLSFRATRVPGIFNFGDTFYPPREANSTVLEHHLLGCMSSMCLKTP